MVAHLNGVKENSLVHRFITSGKPGRCELCDVFVQKLEAHHVQYSPESTINLCHNCHHKSHFWPNRLTRPQILKMLKLVFSPKEAERVLATVNFTPQNIAKLIAPSRNSFIRAAQKLEEVRLKVNHNKT